MHIRVNASIAKSYLKRFLHQWANRVRHLTKDVVWLFFALLILFLQFELGKIEHGWGWKGVVNNVGPTLAVILLFVGYHALLAVVQLDRARAKEIAEFERILEEWPERVELIKLLRGYHREGELLKEELEKVAYPPTSLEQRTKTWRMYSANMLLQRRGETYEERFNKIGTKPELTELAKLHEQIYELKKAMDEAGVLVASDPNRER